jgi:sn-glycerol 3-phosphate transport system permease protein
MATEAEELGPVTPADPFEHPRPHDAPKAHRGIRTVGAYVVLVVLAALVLYPIWMSVVRAISNPIAWASQGRPNYPIHVDFSAFSKAWDSAELGPALTRSFVATVLITSAQLITSTLSAYAFAFLDFPFKKIIFALFMASLLLPIEVTLIANNEIMRDLHWTNTYQGLVLPFLATALGTFLLRQGFLGIPDEIRDSTRLDGIGHLQFLFRFAVPLSKPVIGSFTVIAFLGAWNQYVWPRTVIDQDSFYTVQLSLTRLAGLTPQQANLAPAGALITALPILVILIVFQRTIVRGLTAGAVKG